MCCSVISRGCMYALTLHADLGLPTVLYKCPCRWVYIHTHMQQKQNPYITYTHMHIEVPTIRKGGGVLTHTYHTHTIHSYNKVILVSGNNDFLVIELKWFLQMYSQIKVNVYTNCHIDNNLYICLTIYNTRNNNYTVTAEHVTNDRTQPSPTCDCTSFSPGSWAVAPPLTVTWPR